MSNRNINASLLALPDEFLERMASMFHCDPNQLLTLALFSLALYLAWLYAGKLKHTQIEAHNISNQGAMNNNANLLALPDEVLVHMTSMFHGDPGQLLTLALTCKHIKSIVYAVVQTCIDHTTDEERRNLPGVELPWCNGLISEYKLLLKNRESLKFDRVDDGAYVTDGNASEICAMSPSFSFRGYGVSNRIMRSAVHKAFFEFSEAGCKYAGVGITRPTAPNNNPMFSWREEGYPREWQNETSINSIAIGPGESYASLRTGRNNEFTSHRHNIPPSYLASKVQFILDLNNGTFSVLGRDNEVSEVASGLSGEYVWFASVMDASPACKIRIGEWK